MPPLTPQVLWRSDEEQRRASTTGMAKYDKLRALTSSVVAGLKPRVFFFFLVLVPSSESPPLVTAICYS